MAAYTSVKSGNWNDPATWGSASYPSVDGDTATIAAGHEVIYNVNAPAVNLGAITVYGIFRCSRTMTTYLRLGSGDSNITLSNYGAMYWGDSALAPIPAAYTATICFTFNRGDRGIQTGATTILQMFGDPAYQPDRIKRLAVNWTAGKTFTVSGNVLSTWRVGDKLSLTTYKNATSASPHNTDCVLATIDSMAANGSNTDITIVEAFSLACDAGGPIMNLNCNNIIVTSDYDVLSKTSLVYRYFITKTGGVVQNYYDYPAQFEYVTFAAIYYLYISYNHYTKGCLFRNGYYSAYVGIDIRSYDNLYYAMVNTFYGISMALISGCYFGPYSGAPRDIYMSVYIKDCYVWASPWTDLSGHGGVWPIRYENVKFFCNGTYTAQQGTPNSIRKSCYYYFNYAGFLGPNGSKHENCYFGYDEYGTAKSISSYGDIFMDYGGFAYFKNCKFNWSAGGGTIPTTDGRINWINKLIDMYCENYNQVDGAYKHITIFGDITSDALHYLASKSLNAVPLSNCGYSGPVNFPFDPPSIKIVEWTENYVPASAQSRRVYVRGAGWSVMPTSAQLYFQAEYYNAAGAWTTTTIKSTNVLSGNGVWEPLTLSFTPGRVGPVTYRVVLAKYEAGASVYLDHALYYSATEFIEATFYWGESVLPMAPPPTFPAAADVRALTAYGTPLVPQVGILDLPIEDDVRFGTQYDQLTKEGDLVLPAEAEVLDGVGFGADATEFTGTLDPVLPTKEIEGEVSLPPIDGEISGFVIEGEVVMEA